MLHWNTHTHAHTQYQIPSTKRDNHVFLSKRVKNLNLESKGESDFAVAKVPLMQGGNNNNNDDNEASERPETSRAREEIDLGRSEMKP